MRSFIPKQPISLKWKWGVLLFAMFTLLNSVTVGFLYFQRHQEIVSHLSIATDQQFRQLKNFVEMKVLPFDNLDEIQETNTAEMKRVNEQLEFIQGIKFLTVDSFKVSLATPEGGIIYTNDEDMMRDLSLISNEKASPIQVDGQQTIGLESKIQSQFDGKDIGLLQVILAPEVYQKAMQHLARSMIIVISVLLLLSLGISFLLSHLFLRPLTYLNNSLDLVEEESLSEIRVRKPRSNDEWSDLSVHVNKLLDKIDLYVSNQKQFVEDVSHELRTPIAIVEGHLKLLNRWGKDDPEVLANSIEASLQEMIRMKDLVQEMLDLSRADHVDVDYRQEITEIFSTTRQVFDNFNLIHEDFQFFLDMDQHGVDRLYARLYRNHFEQILIILLDNAVKYSQDRKEIHISVSQTASQVEIAVQDFGEGMSDEDKQKVFGRFYRIDKARSREKGGNGLGLSIAKQLVQSYRGEIWVDSVLGEGSIFYFSLPLLTDEAKISQLLEISEAKKEFNY